MSVARLAKKDPAASRKVWHVLDAEGHRVGRIASRISVILQGKHKPIYEKGIDNGDFVVVVNTNKINFATQTKWKKKLYRWHTGYPGGLKEVPAERMFQKNPNRLIEKAVRGMLPKNRNRREFMGRLKLYSTPSHPHLAQTDAVENQVMHFRSNFKIEESHPLVDQWEFKDENVVTEEEVKDIDGTMITFEEEDGKWYMVTETLGKGLSPGPAKINFRRVLKEERERKKKIALEGRKKQQIERREVEYNEVLEKLQRLSTGK
eukprot:CAMPEP_0201476276 /NCGR_PEP_ID=MMETSP0151_2-20130828/1511_1 /ASSEMBLY_ACC=CAM_ASM_000257 /TAXON_ID=200890 /ORGANISM="Paramoeba atlantica, Strain 621/1 / CCAP 1560/9" /LENGTH=261 /DNA_ID=CAMNT_0047856595 /DNA_START=84 /DNA_END=869 /DNA_ORIENTATION=+